MDFMYLKSKLILLVSICMLIMSSCESGKDIAIPYMCEGKTSTMLMNGSFSDTSCLYSNVMYLPKYDVWLASKKGGDVVVNKYGRQLQGGYIAPYKNESLVDTMLITVDTKTKNYSILNRSTQEVLLEAKHNGRIDRPLFSFDIFSKNLLDYKWNYSVITELDGGYNVVNTFFDRLLNKGYSKVEPLDSLHVSCRLDNGRFVIYNIYENKESKNSFNGIGVSGIDGVYVVDHEDGTTVRKELVDANGETWFSGNYSEFYKAEGHGVIAKEYPYFFYISSMGELAEDTFQSFRYLTNGYFASISTTSHRTNIVNSELEVVKSNLIGTLRMQNCGDFEYLMSIDGREVVVYDKDLTELLRTKAYMADGTSIDNTIEIEVNGLGKSLFNLKSRKSTGFFNRYSIKEFGGEDCIVSETNDSLIVYSRSLDILFKEKMGVLKVVHYEKDKFYYKAENRRKYKEYDISTQSFSDGAYTRIIFFHDRNMTLNKEYDTIITRDGRHIAFNSDVEYNTHTDESGSIIYLYDRDKEEYTFLDHEFKEILPKGFWVHRKQWNSRYKNLDYFVVTNNESNGVVDRKGNWILRPIKDKISAFSSSIFYTYAGDSGKKKFRVWRNINGKWNNKKVESIRAPIRKDTFNIMLLVEMGEDEHLISYALDKNGNEIIPKAKGEFYYSRTSPLYPNKSIIRFNGKKSEIYTFRGDKLTEVHYKIDYVGEEHLYGASPKALVMDYDDNILTEGYAYLPDFNATVISTRNGYIIKGEGGRVVRPDVVTICDVLNTEEEPYLMLSTMKHSYLYDKNLDFIVSHPSLVIKQDKQSKKGFYTLALRAGGYKRVYLDSKSAKLYSALSNLTPPKEIK